MKFWIFKFNPDRCRFQDRLADPDPKTSWIASRYRDQIIPGDTVFVWQTGRERGIRAVLRVDSHPSEIPEIESEQQYWVDRESEIRWRVLATITHRDVNLSHTDIRSTPGLENLSVFHGFHRGTNFPVTSEEGRILLKLIDHESD